MRSIVEFNGETTQLFMPNHRRGSDYKATLDNQTNQTITLTVSNQNPNRGETPSFSPLAPPLTVAAGASGTFDYPWNCVQIDGGAPTTGVVYIIEAG